MPEHPSSPILFLDIDGVLNGHHWMREAQSCNICRPCVLQFNRILRATGARVVLSSTWRYMVTAKSMTLQGFAYMLRTHGAIGAMTWLIDTTAPDEHCPACGHRHGRKRATANIISDEGDRLCIHCGAASTRGAQISRWLADHTSGKVRYVVIDDDDLDITAKGHPLVQTSDRRGLTRYKADEAIHKLREQVHA